MMRLKVMKVQYEFEFKVLQTNDQKPINTEQSFCLFD